MKNNISLQTIAFFSHMVRLDKLPRKVMTFSEKIGQLFGLCHYFNYTIEINGHNSPLN